MGKGGEKWGARLNLGCPVTMGVCVRLSAGEYGVEDLC